MNHPLAAYEQFFRSINWDLGEGGDLSEMTITDQNGREIPLSSVAPALSQLVVPAPIRLIFDNSPLGHEEIVKEYPAGMSVLQILGAINTFYDRHLTDEEQAPFDVDYDVNDYAPGEKFNRLMTHRFFEGLIWDPAMGGYAVSLGS